MVVLLSSLTVAEEDVLIMATKLAEEEDALIMATKLAEEEEEDEAFDFGEQSFLPDNLFEDFIYFLRRKNFYIGKFLSRGAFGSVFDCGEKFVVKLENLQDENMLPIPKSSRFVTVVESGTFHDMRYTIMEKLTPAAYDKKIYLDLVKAIRVLQASNIAHCDIKFDNVMSRGDKKNVLIDFGFAKKIGTKSQFVTGTPFYMSLDAIKKSITKKCDYESLCYMMLEMETANKTLPWDECVPFLDLQKLYQKKLNFLTSVTSRNPKTLSMYKIPNWVVNFICEVRGNCDGSVLQRILETSF